MRAADVPEGDGRELLRQVDGGRRVGLRREWASGWGGESGQCELFCDGAYCRAVIGRTQN